MKHNIEVRIKRKHREPGCLVGTIKRKLRAEACGNFNPVFCTYHNAKHMVFSIDGDLSDPFRREDTYLQTLYIEL